MSQDSWTIVVFCENGKDLVQAVPTVWIIGDECLWPSVPKDKVQQQFKKCLIDTTWPRFKVRVLPNSTYDDYKLAREKAKKAELTSDLNTDEDNEGPFKIKKRAINKPRMIYSSSESELETENLKLKTKKAIKLPKPPKSSLFDKQCFTKTTPNKDLESLDEIEQNESYDLSEDTTYCAENQTYKKNGNADKTINTFNARAVSQTVQSLQEDGLSEDTSNLENSTCRKNGIAVSEGECVKDKTVQRLQELTDLPSNCTTCTKKDRKQIYLITQLLLDLNKKVETLISHSASRSAQKEKLDFIKNLNLPVINEEQLEKLNEGLAEPKNFESMVLHFSKQGGANIFDFIRRTMPMIIKDSVALSYSLMGRKQKAAFNSLPVYKMIVEAAENSGLAKDKKEIETAISNWLKRAQERKKREEVKQIPAPV